MRYFQFSLRACVLFVLVVGVLLRILPFVNCYLRHEREKKALITVLTKDSTLSVRYRHLLSNLVSQESAWRCGLIKALDVANFSRPTAILCAKRPLRSATLCDKNGNLVSLFVLGNGLNSDSGPLLLIVSEGDELVNWTEIKEVKVVQSVTVVSTSRGFCFSIAGWTLVGETVYRGTCTSAGEFRLSYTK